MAKWTVRTFGEPGDREAMMNLVAGRQAARVADYPGLLDLEELLELAEIQQGTMLWLEGQQLAAYAMLDGERLDFEISPQVEAESIAPEILSWAAARAQMQASAGESIALSTGCRAENSDRVALLEMLGFVPEPVRTLHFQRDLRQQIPEPRLPDGFHIRPIAGVHEVENHVALHRAAFGTDEMTVEMRLAMMGTAGYQPQLDLVAAAPDGSLAGYVMCHTNPRENTLRNMRVGYTDPVATHPAYQRLGLARALLLTGLERLKAQGMDYAELGTYGENTGMIQAALSAGFAVCGSTIFFTWQPNGPGG